MLVILNTAYIKVQILLENIFLTELKLNSEATLHFLRHLHYIDVHNSKCVRYQE